MARRSVLRRGAFVLLFLAVCALGGYSVSATAAPSDPTQPVHDAAVEQSDRGNDPAAGQPPATNADGLSYGSALDAPSFEEIPDLVLAHGDGGTLGYVLKADLYDAPTSLEDVLRLPTEVDSNGTVALVEPVREIPLYEVDGVTVIGTYTIGR